MWLLGPKQFDHSVIGEKVFTEDEVMKIMALACDGAPAVLANGAIDTGIRESSIVWIAPSEGTAWIYEILEDAIRTVNSQHFHLDLDSFHDALQLTEYMGDNNGHYGPHADASYDMMPTRKRKLSMSVQLSPRSAYDGGELLLYPNNLVPFKQELNPGDVAFFRSSIIHEVTPVTRGSRMSLVVWACGPELR